MIAYLHVVIRVVIVPILSVSWLVFGRLLEYTLKDKRVHNENKYEEEHEEVLI